jgi:hypothetical protein
MVVYLLCQGKYPTCFKIVLFEKHSRSQTILLDIFYKIYFIVRAQSQPSFCQLLLYLERRSEICRTLTAHGLIQK